MYRIGELSMSTVNDAMSKLHALNRLDELVETAKRVPSRSLGTQCG